MLAKLGTRYTSLSTVSSLMLARPEQLVLPDDPSFLPEFALAPPAHLADLDLDLDFLIAHSGESQSLTPFGSQSSSQAGALGGLVLPTSSPDQPGGFELAGDDGLAGPSGLLGADDLIQLEEPDFTFDIDGNYVEGPPSKVVAGTPAAQQGTGMHSDAGASARVRREHEEGHDDGVQVSFTAISHVIRIALSLSRLAFEACWPHMISHLAFGGLSVSVQSCH
jgi:meiotic recombination protein REC8